MSLDQTKLEKLLQTENSEKAIVRFFKGASEQDRKELSGFCVKNLKSQIKTERDAWRKERNYSHNPLITLAAYAAYCTSTPSQFELGWRTHISGDLVYELLENRRPEWLDQWVEHCCHHLRVANYNEIRRMIREGICSVPANDNFVRIMITAISHNNKTPLAGLQKDPDLLDTLVWRIFETPFVMHGEMMIGYLHNDWADALATLSQKGKLDRCRLFQSCFNATNMGFNREQIKVFLNLHDQLKPTRAERIDMFDSYCGLLDSPLPPVVKFAYETLKQLDKEAPFKEAPLDEQRLCDVLRVTMRSPTKSMVVSTLKWLGTLCKRQPNCASLACLAATEGLLHEKADVQAATWKFIEQHGSDDATVELIDELSRLAPTTSASSRKPITKWLREQTAGQGGDESKDAPAAENTGLHETLAVAKKINRKLATLLGIPEIVKAIKQRSLDVGHCSFRGDELARLPSVAPLPPIETLDDLVEVTARALEDGSRIDDAEQVLAALTRFPLDDEATSKVVDPIVKRAVKRVEKCAPFIGAGSEQDLPAVVAAWSGVDSVVKGLRDLCKVRGEDGPPPGLTGFLGFRSRAVVMRFLDKQPLELLAAPTHAGGWIDPLVLAKRIKKVASVDHLLDFDQVLALLRMAPDNRGKALRAARDVPGEFAAAFRYACGEDVPRIGKTDYLWVAAARARNPLDDDLKVEKKFPGLGVDAGLAARYQVRASGKKKKYDWDDTTLFLSADSPQPKFNRDHWRPNPKVNYLLPTTLPHEHGAHSDFFLDTQPCRPHIFDFAATVWPLNRESFFLPDTHVRALLDPNTPLLEMSTWGMVRALGHGWAPHRTMGVDLAIAAIEDGRWDPQRVGRLMAVELFFTHRFVKTLPEVASCSELHGLQVAMSLQAMLAAQPEPRPTSFGGLLEIAYELLEELQIQFENPVAREFLETITGSSKAAKYAKRILGFEPDSAPNLDAIYQQALQGRLAANRQLVKR